jgi:7-cyano-7-deazaguanine synthase
MNDTDFGPERQRQSTRDVPSPRRRRPGETSASDRSEVVGLLASGGLDSCILLKHLLDVGRTVKPFYIRSGLCWQSAEQEALERYLDAVAVRRLEPLAVLDLPLGDVYGDHWSITGRGVPEAGTPDEAVYLPGRNALLTIKAALWCQMHGIDEVATATLRSNPFEDASASSFDRLGAVLSEMLPRPIRLVRPFGELEKREVMELGRNLPLDLTFSCIAPRGRAHCGRCNKCAERQEAFRLIGRTDEASIYA